MNLSSSQQPLLTDSEWEKFQAEMAFITEELDAEPVIMKRCPDCNFIILHSNWTVDLTSHSTCICMAFGYQAICCENGYENLITKIPTLCTYFLHNYHVPNKYNTDCYYAWNRKKNNIQISFERMKYIKKICREITEKVCYTPPQKAFPIVEYVENNDDPYYCDNYLRKCK